MNEISRSCHSQGRRSVRRIGTAPNSSAMEFMLSRSNSLGRHSLVRRRSRRTISRGSSSGKLLGQRGSNRDAFGDDVFDLDPSADFSSRSSSGSSAFDDDDFPSVDGAEFPVQAWTWTEGFSEETPSESPIKARPLRKSQSRRELMVKSGSRRSLKASQKLLTSSLRNIHASLEF